MSAFQQQLVLSLIDKLFLGAVLVGIGYLFNLAIERLRARNSFSQALSAQRVRAIHEVATFFSQQIALQRDFLAAVRVARDSDEAHEKEALSNLQDAYQKWGSHYRDRTHEVMVNCIYLDREIGDALNAHIEETARVANVVLDRSAKPRALEEIETLHERLLGKHSSFLRSMRTSVHKNPF